MDFMHGTLADGRGIRVLTAIDVYSRECVALVAAQGFTGHAVGRTLSDSAVDARRMADRLQ